MSTPEIIQAANRALGGTDAMQFFSGTAGSTESASFYTTLAGNYQFHATGTFAGGNVRLQVRPAGHSTWIDVAGAALSSSGTISLALAYGDEIKAVRSSTIDIVATIAYAGGF